MTQRTKPCRDCKADKPLKDYDKHGQNADGRMSYCRACRKAKDDKKKAALKEYSKTFFHH